MSDEPVDHREHPEAYRVARGEQGVFHVEPYKSELLPLWRFADPEAARTSGDAIFEKFEQYVADGDAVGADMARKYLQMGFTRSRRYARHPGGRKYDADHEELPVGEEDPVKAASAEVFKELWDRAEANEEYVALRDEHRRRHG